MDQHWFFPARRAEICAALAPVRQRIGCLLAAYSPGYESYRQYRSKVFRLVIEADPVLAAAVRDAAGWVEKVKVGG